MKTLVKLKVLIIVFIFTFSGKLSAVSLILEEVSAIAGETVTVNLWMNNQLEVGGFQFVITPSPSGSVIFSEVTAVGRASGWTVSTNDRDGGTMFLGYSAAGSNMATGDDNILAFKYTIASGTPAGEVELQLSEVNIIDASLNPISDVSITNGLIIINGEDIIKCDFNGDGNKNIADVITLLIYLRDNPGDTGADFNGDGNANIADAIAMLLAMRDGTCPDL